MKTVALLILATLLAGCTMFQNDAERGYAEEGHAIGASGGVIFTTADVRLVIRRRNPVTGDMVTCTEPTPDVAAALSTATQIALQGGNKAANGEIGISGGSAEAVTELAGRTTALLALRDGLYRTCEAYANGVLGAEAYALVLARYGQLMTTLFLGQDIASAVGGGGQGSAGSPASTSSPPLVNFAMQGSGSPPSNTSAGATSPGTGGAGAAQPSGGGSASDPTSAPQGTSATSPAGTSGGSGGGYSDSSSSSSNGQNTPPSPTSGSAIAAASLVRMNEDYFDLDRNLVQLLVVACINQTDPTGIEHVQPDAWLASVCGSMNGWHAIAHAEANAARLELAVKHPAPAVNLAEVGLTQVPSGPATAADKGTESGIQTTMPGASSQVRLLQIVLQSDGYAVGGITGILDGGTIQAMEHYERNNSIPVSSKVNRKLLHYIARDARRTLRSGAR